jgi:uncharacterized membrane protein
VSQTGSGEADKAKVSTPASRPDAVFETFDGAGAEAAPVPVTAQPTPWSWWSVVLIVASIGFVAVFTTFQWAQFRMFNLYGFDTGIFTQGTWLLSQFENPFVTLRGLNLFGDHASFILLLVAPLFRLWPSPDLLVLLQSIAMAVPALVVYKLGARRVSSGAGCAMSLAYLLAPATQWAAAWEFHPEVLAAAFLSMAVLSMDNRHDKRMALYLCLAASCKEDVSLVIFGFGILLVTLGRRRQGLVVSAASLAYFVIVTQVVMRLINGGSGSIYFQRNYGIEGSGPVAIITGMPEVLWRLVTQVFSMEGAEYLALAFAPFLLLSLLGGRWLLPMVAPLCLNLASLVPYQHEISFHYLATSAPFIGVAAVVGLQRVRRWKFAPVPLVLGVMIFVAAGVSYSEGPRENVADALRELDTSNMRYEVLKMIPSDAAVSADYSMDLHLVNRKVVYEFPNPFRPANWGRDDAKLPQHKIDEVEYVIAERSMLGEKDFAQLETLASSGSWEFVFDDGNVVLLHRIAPDSPLSEGEVEPEEPVVIPLAPV